MSAIQIRVGAALDASAIDVFRPLTAAAKAERKRINAELAKIGLGLGPALKETAAQASKDLSRIGSSAKRANADLSAATKTATADATKAYTQMADAAVAAFRKIQVEQEKAAGAAGATARAAGGGRSPASRDDFFSAKRVGHESVANMSRMARGAGRMGIDMARAGGIDLDMGAMFTRSVELQKRATDLSNSGFMMGGSGANGQRQDPKAIMAQARQVATDTAFDPSQVIEGLSTFVGKTGDLDTGRKVLADLAKMAKATGTELEDMVSAAGDVSSALPESADKVEKITSVMRAMAGQGKLGAVEIKDLSKQMAGLASKASMFGGDEATNVAEMGILAQETRQRGGATSATQAVTSVGSFVATFSKQARRKEMEAAGVKVQDENKQLLSPEKIIRASLLATGGDNIKMGKLFMDVRARSVTRGFETVFNKAGGGEKGDLAVKAEFARLRESSMGNGEIGESFKAAMETNAAKAQRFQNQLDLIAEGAGAKLLPAMEKLAPTAIKAAEGLAKLVEFVVGNPGQALAAAITASVAKAAIGEVVSRALSGAIVGGMGGGGVGGAGVGGKPGAGGFIGAGGALGALGAGMMITAAAVTLYAAGSVVLDKAISEYGKGTDESLKGDAEAHNALAAVKGEQAIARKKASFVGTGLGALSGLDAIDAVQREGASAESLNALAAEKAKLQGRVNDAEMTKAGFGVGGVHAAFNEIVGGGSGLQEFGKIEADIAKLGELKTDLAAMNGKLGGVLQVQVTNMPAVGSAAPSAWTPSDDVLYGAD